MSSGWTVAQASKRLPFKEGVSVHRAVRLHIGDGREGSVYEIGEQIGHVPHVIRNHARVVGLIFNGLPILQ
jgi:hypothetical protein